MDGSDERDFVARVRAAQERLRQHVSPTMFIPTTLRVHDGHVDLVLVYEGHQEPGSFLSRAAYLSVLDAPSDKTIVCASRGSFAAAVACAAGHEGRRAVVFVPDDTPSVYTAAIGRQRPYELRRVTGSFRDVELEAQSFARRRNAHFVSGYDDESALLGAGTLAAEIDAEVPGVTDLLVPTGGGGLVGGMAEYFGDRLRVASVETYDTASMFGALKASRAIRKTMGGVAVMSLGIPQVGARGLEAAQRWRSQPVTVRDDAALTAMTWLWNQHHLPVDPGAAAPLAALMRNRYGLQPHGRTVVVVSGSIVDPVLLSGR